MTVLPDRRGQAFGKDQAPHHNLHLSPLERLRRTHYPIVRSHSSRPVRVQPPPSTGYATYYVRPDGGSAAQCNGLVNAPHTGASRDCAWDHPFRALPPAGPPRIAGGDTLVIGSGSYMIGYGAPEADRKDDSCSQDNPWDCTMLPVPSGPDPGHPTRILGSGWDRGCPQPPALWGTERVARILDLAGTENAEIACLEITDHAGCAEHHAGGLACHRDAFPYGSWAPVGVYAADSSDVLLCDLDIHGLASTGVHAGRLTDWTLENVRIAGNGWAGWDGDLWEGSSSNTGTLRFRNWTVEWNGCVETWPEQAPAGCWAQTAGGYGDGVGTAATGGVWIIEDSSFLHNTSDGLDLLYHTEGGSVSLGRSAPRATPAIKSRSRDRSPSPTACWWGTVRISRISPSPIT